MGDLGSGIEAGPGQTRNQLAGVVQRHCPLLTNVVTILLENAGIGHGGHLGGKLPAAHQLEVLHGIGTTESEVQGCCLWVVCWAVATINDLDDGIEFVGEWADQKQSLQVPLIESIFHSLKALGHTGRTEVSQSKRSSVGVDTEFPGGGIDLVYG